VDFRAALGLPVFFAPAAEFSAVNRIMTARHPIATKSLLTRHSTAMTVLFADICGSTRLYCSLGNDAARAIVAAGLDALVDLLPSFGGRLVKTLGDEVMCVFPEPDQAVLAAAAMQAQVEATRPAGHALAIHVGLHHGPVLLEGGDLFGDTVNAASYLCAVASRGQILTTEATIGSLSEAVRERTRPLFFAVIKGSSVESALYQVIWQQDSAVLTDVNLRRHNLVPPDSGSLLVSFGHAQVRIDPRRPSIVLGRDPQCDIAIGDSFASRRHATLILRRTQVYLSDHSSNGTFVRRNGGESAHVFRSELLLDGAGELSLGRAFDQGELQVVGFRRDRRALYRV
jgi:class 3 adenylate cyclase